MRAETSTTNLSSTFERELIFSKLLCGIGIPAFAGHGACDFVSMRGGAGIARLPRSPEKAEKVIRVCP
jgi:hypothetical protein